MGLGQGIKIDWALEFFILEVDLGCINWTRLIIISDFGNMISKDQKCNIMKIQGLIPSLLQS